MPGANGGRGAGGEVIFGHNWLNRLRGFFLFGALAGADGFYFFPHFSALFRSPGHFTG